LAIGNAGGVFGWEGWRLLLLLEASKKIFHQGIGYSGWAGMVDWFSSGVVWLERTCDYSKTAGT
jgi:hypothetical protein